MSTFQEPIRNSETDDFEDEIKLVDVSPEFGSEPHMISTDTIIAIPNDNDKLDLPQANIENTDAKKFGLFSRSERQVKNKTTRSRGATQKIKDGVKYRFGKTSKAVSSYIKEFGSFMGDGRILQYAIGMVIGTAFTTVIGSFVNDLISPFIGLAIGTQLENFYLVLKSPDISVCLKNQTKCSFHTLLDAHSAGAVTWNLGSFLQNVLNFLIVAFAVFSIIRFLKGFISSTKSQLKSLKTGLSNTKASFGSLNSMATAVFRKKDRISTGSSSTSNNRNSDLKGGNSRPRSVSDSKIMKTADLHESESLANINESRPNTASTEDTTFSTLFTQASSTSPIASADSELYYNHAFHFPFHQHHPLRECPYCFSHIPQRATRCARCTSVVEVEQSAKLKNDSKKNVKFDMNFANIPFHV